MNKKTVLVAGLVFLALVPVFSPTVAALTWTAEAVTTADCPSNSCQGSNVEAAAFGGNRWIAWQDSETFDIQVSRSIQGGAWATTTVSTTNVLGEAAISLQAFNANVLIMCFDDDTGDDIKFARSGDAGVLWSVVTVKTTDLLEQCTIAALSTTNYLIVYFNDTSNEVYSTLSTDSGATWATSVLVGGNDVGAGSVRPRKMVLQAESSTNALLVFQDSSRNFIASRTTNAGTSWAGAVISGVTGEANGNGGLHLDLAWSGTAGKYALLFKPSNSFINFCVTSDQGVTWGCGSAVALTEPGNSGTASTKGITRLNDDQSWGIVFEDRTTAADTTPMFYSQTLDGGGTWSTPESVETFANAVSEDIGIDIAYDVSTGEVFIGLEYDPGQGDLSSVDQIVRAFTAPFASQAIGAVATSDAFTSLVGFSIDSRGLVGIVRTNSGDFIRTLSGSDLVTVADEETDCTRTDAVLSQFTPSDGAIVLYMDCAAGGNPDTFRIKTIGLTDPSLSGCSSNECDDIDTDEFLSPADDDQLELAQLERLPLDYSTNRQIALAQTAYQVGWAFSGTGTFVGQVGILIYTNNEPGDEEGLTRRYNMGTSSAANDICTGVDGVSHYLAAVQTSVPTVIIPITYSGDDGTLDAQFGTAQSISGALGGANGVSCGGRRIGIAGDSTFGVVNRTGGAPVWTTDCSCLNRGTAMSKLRSDGEQFVAWMATTTTWNVAYANNGSVVATGEKPTGSFYSMEIDENAQSLWIATNSVVARYDLTAVDEIGIISDAGEEADDPVVGDGLFANSGSTVGDAFGAGAFGGNLFLGTVLIGLVAYGVGTGYGNTEGDRMGSRVFRVNPVAAALGAVLGFLVAWAFGFFSTAVVFSLVVLASVALGVKFWRGRQA